jgi:hypothetical protein
MDDDDDFSMGSGEELEYVDRCYVYACPVNAEKDRLLSWYIACYQLLQQENEKLREILQSGKKRRCYEINTS